MDLLQNPFQILSASPRDNRRRIKELADERSLLFDSSECIQASADLTNPRKRLSAEVAWLPGIGPKLTGEVLLLLESSPLDILNVDQLTSIARANLLAAGLTRFSNYSPDNVSKWILAIALAFEGIDPKKLGVTINEERIVSGFPEVTDFSALEIEIQERRRYYRQAIKYALNNLSAKELVKSLTVAVEYATAKGEKHGPILIADLVDSYEVDAQVFLEKEEGNINTLVEKLRMAVDTEQPDSTLAPMVNQLIQVVKNWDTIAQPIQVSTKSRGLNHDASHRVASLVRELAIHMFNKHGKFDFSKQLTNMLKEVFAEVGNVAEQTAEDANTLREISVNRNQLFAQFKEFNLNGNNFSYKGKKYSTNDINHVGFYRAITSHETLFVETYKTEQANIFLAMNNGQEVLITVDEQEILFSKNKSLQIKTVVDFYVYLSHITFDRRVEFYESQIRKHGYFTYDECYFFPNDRIVFKDREFHLSSTSFLQEYGYIEMKKKDPGILDRIVSLAGTPKFQTIIDTDVIFHLLDKHFSLRWKS